MILFLLKIFLFIKKTLSEPKDYPEGYEKKEEEKGDDEGGGGDEGDEE